MGTVVRISKSYSVVRRKSGEGLEWTPGCKCAHLFERWAPGCLNKNEPAAGWHWRNRLSPFSFAPLPFDRFALKQFYLFIILHGKNRPVKLLFENFVKYLM